MKIITTLIAGLILATSGLLLRINAMAIARLDATTIWEAPGEAFWRQTWIDLGNIAWAGGIAVITLALHHWIQNTERTETNSQD